MSAQAPAAPTAPANGAHAQAAPPPPAPTEDPAFWDAEPGAEIERPPLFLVVIAEAGLGKTHIGLTFPGPVVVLDTEFRADEVLRKFRNVEKYWKKVEAWSDIREAAARALKRHAKSPGTFVFDSGSDLNLLAEAEVLAELKDAGKGAHKTLHWGPVNKRFKGLFGTLRDRRWNAVFTARLKDEWKGEDRTGARVPGGFVTDKLVYHADFAIRLERGPDGARVGRVLKNGGRKVGTYAEVLMDEQLSYAGIIAEMEAPAVQVLVAASPSGIRPAAPAPAPALAPTNTGSPASAAPSNPSEPPCTPTPISPAPQGGSLPAGAGVELSPTPAPAPSSTPAAAAAPAQELPTHASDLEAALLERAGFKLTGQPAGDGGRLSLSEAAKLASDWEQARDKKRAAEMVALEHALGRAGWFRAPSAPVALASAEQVAEIEALAIKLGSTAAGFWSRAKAKGWTARDGELPVTKYAEAKAAMSAALAKAGAASAAPAAAA